MTLPEKLNLQEQNTNKVFLFKEGVFYKAYNEGVFLLKDLNYKINTKQLAKTKEVYVSIGFPLSVLCKLKETNVATKVKTEGVVSLNAPFNFKIEAFKNWKQQQLINTQVTITNKLNKNHILEEIKNYPLANKTPIEVFTWVAAIQLKIKS